MIKNIIFDFGDIFINLDKEIIFREMQRYGNPSLTPELIILSNAFEVGQISPDIFINGLQTYFPKASTQEIIAIWNGMLLDFPDYRLEFIEKLANEKEYRLFLLSNNNALHKLEAIKIMGSSKFESFKCSFEQFYLSHEIHLRKPNTDIYEFVLEKNGLDPTETFFVDDDIIQLKSKL
jgi:putative hydrolase of the HAD superfamily